MISSQLDISILRKDVAQSPPTKRDASKELLAGVQNQEERSGANNNRDGDSAKIHRAIRTHTPSSFELPTENFTRKTGMRDRGSPGFEYNNTEYLSISTPKPGGG